MVKTVLLAALVFVAPAHPALSQDTKVSVDMTGIGALSCAHWRSTQEHLSEGTVWIYGFWTRVNYWATASDQAQSETDNGKIMAEVKKTCAQVPSQTLASAVWTTYLEFNRRKRRNRDDSTVPRDVINSRYTQRVNLFTSISFQPA